MARTEIQPVCFFINKNSIGTLLDPFLRCCLWLMSDTTAEMDRCDSDHVTHSIYLKYLLAGPLRKSLPTPAPGHKIPGPSCPHPHALRVQQG